MSDLISRKRLLSVIKPMVGMFTDEGFYVDYKEVLRIIENAPPADGSHIEVRKWIKEMKVIKDEKFEIYDPKWYCPSCGKEYDPAAVKVAGIKFCYGCGERVEE